MGMQLNFSTTFYPQTDGQIERINGMLEQYLCHYASANQDNWVRLLDFAQFAHNSHRSSTTGHSPFELVLSRQPLSPPEATKQHRLGQLPAAYHYAQCREELLEDVREALGCAA